MTTLDVNLQTDPASAYYIKDDGSVGAEVALMGWEDRMGEYWGQTKDGWFLMSRIFTQEGRVFKLDDGEDDDG